MKGSRRTFRALWRVARTHYPGFIFGLPLGQRTPVFTYHDVERGAFAADLEFLARNHYRTLTLDEYLAPRRTPLKNAVLLSFDDARKSFYTVALPLLREFNAHATLFVPTYWMRGAGERGDGTDLFMSWAQVRECRDSGHVEVQSHAHRHALVHTGSEVVAFATPQSLASSDIYDWPMRKQEDREVLGRPDIGTPVYAAEPLLSASRRYVENQDVAESCRQFAVRSGGAQFLRSPQGISLLKAEHRRLTAIHKGYWMAARDFELLVRSEFELSRDEFIAELGYSPSTLAFPWMMGSRESLRFARQAGITRAFGTGQDFSAEADRTLALPVHGRLNSDWLRLLPGRGRAQIIGALGKKVSGFVHSRPIAH